MRDKYTGWYPKSPEEALALWDRTIFVPDANVLLHCLRHTAEVREELLRLFEAMGEALWIPYQVGLEFHRNRLSVEFGAFDAYDSLVKDQELIFEKARDRLRQLRAHPTIRVQEELAAIDMFFDAFKERMSSAREGHPSAEMGGVVDRLTSLLDGRVGEKWTEDRLAGVKKRGEERYAKKIPPGYKDSKKDAGDFDKFGDLIIWEDMIAKAKESLHPVIFITDDVKEDWWWIHRGRKIGPRPELVEEFKAASGQSFHMYEFTQFLRFAEARFPGAGNSVEKVEESLLADEEARRLQTRVAEEGRRAAEVRLLEDEKDYLIALLSGAPGRHSGESGDRGDRGELRLRLSEVIGVLSSLSSSPGEEESSGEAE